MNVEFEDLQKLEIRAGTIVLCENVKDSDKLLRLKVDFGGGETRTVFTGMAKWYKPKDLEGMQTIFLINIKPRKMMGEESRGMILAFDTPNDGKPVFLIPKDKAENGWRLI